MGFCDTCEAHPRWRAWHKAAPFVLQLRAQQAWQERGKKKRVLDTGKPQLAQSPLHQLDSASAFSENWKLWGNQFYSRKPQLVPETSSIPRFILEVFHTIWSGHQLPFIIRKIAQPISVTLQSFAACSTSMLHVTKAIISPEVSFKRVILKIRRWDVLNLAHHILTSRLLSVQVRSLAILHDFTRKDPSHFQNPKDLRL